jgi:hypothetical protein
MLELAHDMWHYAGDQRSDYYPSGGIMPDHACDRGAARPDPGASRSQAYQPEADILRWTVSLNNLDALAAALDVIVQAAGHNRLTTFLMLSAPSNAVGLSATDSAE